MKSILPTICLCLSLTVLCLGTELGATPPPKNDYAEPFIDVETLPSVIRRTLDKIHVGMTRAKVEEILNQDGGLLFGGHERYYVPGFTTKSKLVMIEIEFQSVGMTEAVFSNLRLRIEWLRDHDWGDKDRGEAVVRGIGKPYLSMGAID